MTHNERVLQLLSDGRPHSHHELYGLHVIAHSRVADLRKKGYVIEQWREGDDYFYQLETVRQVGVAADGSAADPASPPDGPSSIRTVCPPLSPQLGEAHEPAAPSTSLPEAPPVQLTVFGAAA